MTTNIKTEFYKFNTKGIEVRVKPEYIINQSSPMADVFIWAYHIKINNQSNSTFQLVSRYWKIIDEKGGTQEISGEGVIGEQPILTPGSNFYYSSGVSLAYPSGIMSGHYVMRGKEDNQAIDVKIPAFSLDVPHTRAVIN